MKRINLDAKLQPFRNTVRTIIAEEMKRRVEAKGPRGLAEYAGEYLERLSVVPEFVSKERPDFAEMRKSLNTKGGVMISNHPSILDAQLLLQALEREDYKLVVTPELYERAKGTVLENIFIPAARESLSEMKKMVKTIQEHIAAGGLVWIFPTGGAPRGSDEEPRHFASGFNLILNELAPEDMVYLFHIDHASVRPVAGYLRINVPFLSGEFLPRFMNVAKMHGPHTVQIDERCMTAAQWKDVAQKTGKRDRNRALTGFYLQQFGISGDELSKISRG